MKYLADTFINIYLIDNLLSIIIVVLFIIFRKRIFKFYEDFSNKIGGNK